MGLVVEGLDLLLVLKVLGLEFVLVSLTFAFNVPCVVRRLFSTFTKPLRTSFEMFSARSAVRTRYIIPIIFCLGVSLAPAMIYLFNRIKLQGLFAHGVEHVRVNRVQ